MTSPPRPALRRLLWINVPFCGVAAFLPSPFPLSVPALHAPLWLLAAAVSLALAGRLRVAGLPPRPVAVGAGWVLLLIPALQAFVIGDLPGLLGLLLGVGALGLLTGQVTPRTRKALVAVHALFSGTWLGIAVIMTALPVVALGSDDPAFARSLFETMEQFDKTIVPWSSVGTIVSGVGVGLTTKWGLVRNYWVATKLVLSLTVLVMAFAFLHDSITAAVVATDRIETTGRGAAPDGGMVAGFGAAAVLIGVAMVITVFKPWGRVRRHGAPSAVRRGPVGEAQQSLA